MNARGHVCVGQLRIGHGELEGEPDTATASMEAVTRPNPIAGKSVLRRPPGAAELPVAAGRSRSPADRRDLGRDTEPAAVDAAVRVLAASNAPVECASGEHDGPAGTELLDLRRPDQERLARREGADAFLAASGSVISMGGGAVKTDGWCLAAIIASAITFTLRIGHRVSGRCSHWRRLAPVCRPPAGPVVGSQAAPLGAHRAELPRNTWPRDAPIAR